MGVTKNIGYYQFVAEDVVCSMLGYIVSRSNIV